MTKPLIAINRDEIVIDHGPFTDVIIAHSTFRRWSSSRIEEYYAATRLWHRWGWLHRLGILGRWVATRAEVPQSEPADRSCAIQYCTLIDPYHGYGIKANSNA